VRGTQDGLVLHLPVDLPRPALIEHVREYLADAGSFFRRAEMVIDYGTRPPDSEELGALRSVLAAHAITIRSVTAAIPAYRELLRAWGYQTIRLNGRDDATGVRDLLIPHPEGERGALYVRRTLRSGSSVRSVGDIVILGDVNAGAQVFAGGDVIVWGVVRGTVHAGMNGDFSSAICALRLVPTQLRIGTIVARPPDEPGTQGTTPMIARVQDGEIVVEDWRSDRRFGR
jgi:septum site-determining protein MinC